ncbi:MAG: phosphoribosylglycinamide formyltransferase [Clostridiales bacterium]|jgi:phosphoribosylglycinamide formyltransferase-1|nr:phosphoribosylglycinamide formyltransferase [Clostridiales bacterium]
MTQIGVLVSGGGTNLQAVIDRIADGTLGKCAIAVVISSRPGAYALERAARAGLPAVCVERRRHGDIDEYTRALVGELRARSVELVVMAGFLTITGRELVEAYPNRIINVHPALIPSFCGKGFYGLAPHQKALEYGVKVTGATTHFATLEADAGPIIMQKAVEVREDDTPESLQRRVMEQAEQVILPESIRLYSEGRLRVEGRRVAIAR